MELMNNLKRVRMKIVKTSILITALIVTFQMQAQNSSGYFGHNYFISLEKAAYLDGSSYTYDPQFSSLKSTTLPRIRVDKIINKRTILGLSYERTNVVFTDRNSSLSSASRSDVNVNGSDFKADEGTGKFNVKSNAYTFHIKKFKTYKAMNPIGNFHSWEIGFASNLVAIEEGYTFYSYFNGTSRINKSEITSNYQQIILGYNRGKAFRIYKESLILNLSIGFRFKPNLAALTPDLRGRYEYESHKFLNGKRAINARIGLSYAL
jgi:hypothetical protein